MIDARHWPRLALAAVISCAAHAAVVVLARIELPPPPEERLALAVRIVSPPARAHVPESAPPRAGPKHVHKARERVAAVDPVRLASIAAPDSGAFELPRGARSAEYAERWTAADDDDTAITAAAEDAPAPAAEPVVVATAPPSTFVPEAPAVHSLPRKGRITYNLVYGRDGFPVGRTVQTWEMDGATYRLASRSETTGLVDLFRSQHRTYFSRGAVTRNGLRPATFLMSRNRGRGTEEARAQFDWDGANVTLGPASQQRSEALPPRSQDLLSFMYQLSLDPPPTGRLRQAVTNGSRMETYELDVLPEETIETPLGALRALPLKQLRKAGQETIELWLATEYRYLPVRVRFFNREGEPQGEQIVTEIRLSDE